MPVPEEGHPDRAKIVMTKDMIAAIEADPDALTLTDEEIDTCWTELQETGAF